MTKKVARILGVKLAPYNHKNYASLNSKNKKLSRKWDSERELFYDDILHVLQSTIALYIYYGTDIEATQCFTIDRKQQVTITTVKRNLNKKLQVNNGEIHFVSSRSLETI